MKKSKSRKLAKVTLRQFLDHMGHGSGKSLADEVGITKGSVSNIATGRQYASYPLAKHICAYAQERGYLIDIETLMRTENA